MLVHFNNARSLRFITYLTIVGVFLKVPAAKSVSKNCLGPNGY